MPRHALDSTKHSFLVIDFLKFNFLGFEYFEIQQRMSRHTLAQGLEMAEFVCRR